jgi:release factor H-coupled RctB family protein
MSSWNSEKVVVIASDKNWIEGNAVSQLRGTAGLDGMQLAVGLPDLHPGKAGPVGAAFVTRGVIYPHLVGNDVGCGMGLWLSDLQCRKAKLERWADKLNDLDQPWSGDRVEWLAQFCARAGEFDEALGTIGGGNHFAELQQVEEIRDAEAFGALGLDADRLVVLVHSGSRGLGGAILREHQRVFGYAGLQCATEQANAYVSRHEEAVAWAHANRALIAQRFLAALGSDAVRVLDVPHNFMAREQIAGGDAWIHRKGANPSTRGAVVIPGSRGALSFLVAPRGPQDGNANSVSHGAGRKWNRSDCRARLRERFDTASLERTELGGRVICEDRELLYEEAPQAYKNIEVVVQDLVEAGLVRVIATFRPLITYKTRRAVR